MLTPEQQMFMQMQQGENTAFPEKPDWVRWVEEHWAKTQDLHGRGEWPGPGRNLSLKQWQEENQTPHHRADLARLAHEANRDARLAWEQAHPAPIPLAQSLATHYNYNPGLTSENDALQLGKWIRQGRVASIDTSGATGRGGNSIQFQGMDQASLDALKNIIQLRLHGGGQDFRNAARAYGYANKPTA